MAEQWRGLVAGSLQLFLLVSLRGRRCRDGGLKSVRSSDNCCRDLGVDRSNRLGWLCGSGRLSLGPGSEARGYHQPDSTISHFPPLNN